MVSSRPTSRAPELPRAEFWLLVFAGADVVILPWALGGMAVWSQVIAGVLGATSLFLGLQVYHGGNISGVSRLRRFPFFWLGLVYFGVIAVQMLNPAWRYRAVAAGWYFEQIPFRPWLPHGLSGAPFNMVNASRVLLIDGAIWALVCGLWAGITRRTSARRLLTVIVANGALVGVVFLAQRMTGATRVLWLWDAPADYFVGGFLYKNHAGAFFNLIFAGALGLAWWHMTEADRKLSKSHPGVLFVFVAIVVLVAQLFTYARAAGLLSAGILVVATAALSLRLLRRPGNTMPLPVMAALALLGAAFIGVCVYSLDTDKVWEKFGRLLGADQALSVTARQLATRATFDMAKASPVVGHGAGSFRFLFPLYQQRYPEIYQLGGGNHFFWEHAHDDYVEILAENGWLGAALAAVAAVLGIVCLVRSRALQHFGFILILLGPVAVLVHAGVDFPLHNPAVLTTAAVCFALVGRWAQLEGFSRKGD
jgi:O-antigen ligase